ncbi:hypothetical protein N7478_007885 [Penicillium angulare]|uniref:uncharacterized protein n=1 Tax=Penicillium angulare TaxID=116970 RepID=UPI00254264E7|nr:uncharacterized protein N7478_007885 [Penicillium angulare]KAJ5272760.1 hypothetical protein N7478_007885 [Penicillium angulare]
MTSGSSALVDHATSTPPRKPSTRTVAQRKVYGKKKKNAPRAVLDPKSPSCTPDRPQEPSDPVEAIQTKLAQVSLVDETARTPALVPEVPETPTKELGDQSKYITIELDDELTTDSSLPQQPARTPTKQPCPDASPTRRNGRQKTVEVRIYNKKSNNTKSTRAEKDEAPSASTQTPRKKTAKARRSSGFVRDPEANSYVQPILNEALSPLASQSIQRFSTWASRSASMFDVAKLAEGSYGEVYKLHLREESSRPAVSKSKLAKLKAYGNGVFKVVPLCAKKGPGSKKFTSIAEIASEVKMLKYLDPIPGFARFREIHVVQGRFPESFQRAWEHYKETKDDCENPNPASKKAYPETQLWAIVEMDDAGCELEKFSWSSIFQIYDIFWGVAMALARAEEYALFEHRDLHLGNVCIQSTRPDGTTNPPTDMEIARQSSPSGFGLGALETTIIDYSLSRADLRLGDLPDDPDGVIENASSDLDKKQIFDAVGEDEDEILLRNTYRYMRATLYTGNPSDTEKPRNVQGIWAEYAPRTNLVWLLFILKNLMKNRKPEPTQSTPVPVPQPQRKALAPCSPNRAMERQPTKGKTNKANDQSLAGALVKERQSKDLQTRVMQLKQTLEDRMKTVLALLDLENGHEDMCCAADLVAYAMDSQWLAEQDFF